MYDSIINLRGPGKSQKYKTRFYIYQYSVSSTINVMAYEMVAIESWSVQSY